MKVKIDIDTRTFIRFGLVVLGFLFAIFFVYKARTPLTIIGISVFLALALNPPVHAISKRLPSRSRVGATALAYFIMLAFLGGILFLVIPPVVEQSAKFATTVPSLIDQVASQRHLLDDFVDRYGLGPQLDQAILAAKNQASNFASNIGNILIAGAGKFFNGIVNLIVIVVLTFLMLVEGPYWMRTIWGLYTDPDKLEWHKRLVTKMYKVVTGFVNGQLLVASIASVLTMIVIFILSALFPLGANLAVPLGALIFLTAFIPMIGATLGATIVALLLLLNSPIAAVVFVVYFVIYQQIENNFIAPTIQSKSVDLSALLVLSAILIGISVFGLLGGIISIPIAGCLKVLLVEYLEYSRKQREKHSIKHPIEKLVTKIKEA